MKARVLIADDHELVRRGLRQLLEAAEYEVCGEVANGLEAVEQGQELKPDLVVMDVAMPGLNGIEACRQLTKELPRVQVLMLSAHDTQEVIRRVFSAGARGFVLKTDTGRDLVSAIETLREGKPFFSARIADFLLQGLVAERTDAGGAVSGDGARPPLTLREREVLQLLVEGQSTKEVAATLNIGIKTAETHRTNLMNKLGVRSIAELVRFAIKNKLVEP